MRKFLSLLIIAFTSLALVASEAEAKRFGGGRSLGKQRPSQSRQAAPPPRSVSPSRPASPSSAAAPTRQSKPSGASRWLGPLAGLAAGGLLAAMLFGDGFEGLRIMDILLFAALIFGAIYLFRNIMRRRSVSTHRYATQAPTGFQTPAIGSGLGSGMASESTSPQSPPAWFNANGFVAGAKTHFVNLQAAWDVGNMGKIQEYVTPALFAELRREREALGSEHQYTEVVTVEAQLLGWVYEGDNIIVSVRFTGLIKEDQDGQPQPFDETWHVQHVAKQASGSWYVAGIQQN